MYPAQEKKNNFNKNKLIQTIKDSYWIIIGKIITFFISFGLMTTLAYFIDKEKIGTYNYIISILTLAGITTFSGATTSLISAVAKNKEGSTYFLAKKRVLGGLLSSIIILIIGIYYLYKGNNILGYTFLFGSPFLPLTDTINEIAIAYWQGKKNFKKSTIYTITYQLLFTIPSIIVLFFTKDIFIIIISFLFFQTISGFILYKTIKTKNIDRDIPLEKFSLHLTIMNGLKILSNTIDKIIVWQILGPIQLAIYTFSIIPINKLEQLIPIEQISLPYLSKEEDSFSMRNNLIKKAFILFLSLIPLIFIVFFISPLFYKIFFPNFKESIPLFQILLLSPLLSFPILLKTGLISWKKQKDLYIIETIVLLIKITLMLTGGEYYGLYGIVYGIVTTKIIEGILIFIIFKHNSYEKRR